MFGSAPDSAHPVVVIVNELEVKMTEAGEALEAVARPRLKQLRDCLDYHLLQQRAHTLTSALHTITTSISQVSPVGHSLSSAETVLQQQNNNHQKLQVRIGHRGWGWGPRLQVGGATLVRCIVQSATSSVHLAYIDTHVPSRMYMTTYFGHIKDKARAHMYMYMYMYMYT